RDDVAAAGAPELEHPAGVDRCRLHAEERADRREAIGMGRGIWEAVVRYLVVGRLAGAGHEAPSRIALRRATSTTIGTLIDPRTAIDRKATAATARTAITTTVAVPRRAKRS